MDKEVAREVVKHLEAANASISSALFLARERASEAEFARLRLAAADVIAIFVSDMLGPIYREHADLVPERLRSAGWK